MAVAQFQRRVNAISVNARRLPNRASGNVFTLEQRKKYFFSCESITARQAFLYISNW